MLPSCTASQLRSLAYVDTNHILMHHHPETRLDGEVVSIFAYGLCTEYFTLGFRWQGMKTRALKAGSIPIVIKCGP